MDAKEFAKKLESSPGLSLIVAGLGRVVDDEGYMPHEALELLEATKHNINPALMEIYKESNEE